MVDRLASALLALAMLTGFTACGDGPEEAAPTTHVALDGSPRVPDAEGILIDVDLEGSQLTLEGERTFTFDRTLQSFSTLDGSTQPVRTWVGSYVQVGVEGTTVEWLAGIADVVRVEGEPPVVYYIGDPVDSGGGAVTFADGTVLRLGDGVAAPGQGGSVVVSIDPTTQRVIAIDMAE